MNIFSLDDISAFEKVWNGLSKNNKPPINPADSVIKPDADSVIKPDADIPPQDWDLFTRLFGPKNK